MEARRGCLVRYGRTNRMEWFTFSSEFEGSLRRGGFVVIQTSRGEELGEVLLVEIRAESDFEHRKGSGGFPSVILRIAEECDRERSRTAEALRESRYEDCSRLLTDGRWPVVLLDVEPLLDGRTTVVNLLKADDFDLTALKAQFRDWYDFEVVLDSAANQNEPAILIPADPSWSRAANSAGCGSGGCGSAGGCGCRPI